MMYQTAGGDGSILIYLVGAAIVLVNWIIKSRSTKNADGESTPESQPPRREPSIAHPGAVHPKAARSPQPVAVPPTLTRRGTVAPHSLREQMAEKDEVAAAGPLRSAGESPGNLRTHVDEWMGQDLPEFKTMQVPGRPPPNRLADAPPPPTVSLPAAVLAKRAPRQLATLALVASRGRHPYHLTFNPRTMRQAVVLTEVLGRPRGYDL